MREKSDILSSAHHSHHYKNFTIEPLEYIEANAGNWKHAFHVGNIIKYVSRYEQKNGIDDLRKALFYIQRLIELTEQETM